MCVCACVHWWSEGSHRMRFCVEERSGMFTLTRQNQSNTSANQKRVWAEPLEAHCTPDEMDKFII